jgi:hypothetical protein
VKCRSTLLQIFVVNKHSGGRNSLVGQVGAPALYFTCAFPKSHQLTYQSTSVTFVSPRYHCIFLSPTTPRVIGFTFDSLTRPSPTFLATSVHYLHLGRFAGKDSLIKSPLKNPAEDKSRRVIRNHVVFQAEVGLIPLPAASVLVSSLLTRTFELRHDITGLPPK